LRDKVLKDLEQMQIKDEKLEHENLVKKLNDKDFLIEYKTLHDNYKTDMFPRIIGNTLVCLGNFFYGKQPSFIKFRAVEVIARVPYQSWSSVAYTLLTLFYANEEKAIKLLRLTNFSRYANDNETMHVVVISKIVKEEHKHVSFFLHTLIPMLFSFFYFWVSYLLSLINRKWSYELNYLFEGHAFSQYEIFVDRYSERLKEKGIDSQFLKIYGREVKNQYELFVSVRNDELIHRNRSVEEILNLSNNAN
jgi:ubiquinol oxidase